MLGVAAILFEDIDEDDQDVANELRREHLLRKQFLRNTSDPFNMGDHVFRKHYRMTPLIAIQLIELLRPQLVEHPKGVPIHLQVLSVLRFLAEGSYQKGVAQDCYHPMSQSTFSKYLHAVIPAIVQYADDYIVFPRNAIERQEISRRFEAAIGFPGVLGAIDCTLPKIHTPADHEEAYVNHHQDHSLSVQVVSDMDYNILNIRICNGSTNDRFVWRHSEMRQIMYDLRDNREEGEDSYYLIGDGGYTPSVVLLTPYPDAPIDSPEFRFSDNLRRSRVKVEQTFGIWKQMFRCIHGDRSLHYSPDFAAQIVLASGVIYNFLRHNGQPMPVPPRCQLRLNEVPPQPFNIDNEYIDGLQERQTIIRRHFV